MSKIRIFLIGLITLIMIGALVGVIFILKNSTQIADFVYIVVGVFALDLVFAFIIINSRRYVYVKISWLFTITLLPLIGVILFCVFGIVPFTRKRWRENLKEQKQYIRYEDFTYSNRLQQDNNDIANIYRYSLKTIAKPIYEHNDIHVINSSKELYDETIRLIRSAKKFIHITTFVIRDGVFFRTIICELIRKAQAGVKIRFLYDWLGTALKYHKGQLRQLKRAGVEIGVFNPKGINMFKGSSNYRMHTKMVIIDNKEALYGDSNFGDEYLNISRKTHYWKLLNFIVAGEIVNSLNIVFCNYWTNFTDYTISTSMKQELVASLPEILKINKVESKIDMQLIQSEPNFEEKNLVNVLASLFGKAKHSIKIVTPYFLPTDNIVSALTTASWSGVDVQLILPGKPDAKRYIIPINRSEYKNLLNAKCSIYEYNGFIHSKYYIIDDKYVLIGSANLDSRSLLMHFENVILINNDTFVKQMVNTYDQDKANTHLVSEQFWRKQHTWRIRIFNSLINLYKPML